MDGTNHEVIAQTTVTLPFLDDTVPALYLAQLLEMVDNLNNLCKSPLDWFFRH